MSLDPENNPRFSSSKYPNIKGHNHGGSRWYQWRNWHDPNREWYQQKWIYVIAFFLIGSITNTISEMSGISVIGVIPLLLIPLYFYVNREDK